MSTHSPTQSGLAATRRAQARLGMVLVAPAVILFAIFFVFPLLSAVYFSFTSWDGISERASWIGLGNYQEMLHDSAVLHALLNNVTWVIVGTVLPLAAGLLLAVLMWSGVRGVLLYRLIFFLPFLMPPIAIGIVWIWIYDPLSGWVNRVLGWVGLESLQRGWLGEPGTALAAVLVAAAWSATGFIVVILLAALQSVDPELVDASRVDGANAARRLWHVILPQIAPVFVMVTTVTMVGGFAVFDIVYIMTNGGPGDATQVLGIYAFDNAFRFNRVGYGTTLALLITVISLPLVILLNRVQRYLTIRNGGLS